MRRLNKYKFRAFYSPIFTYSRSFVSRKTNDNTGKFKINMETLNMISDMNSDFNGIFSVPVLLQLAGKFILLITFTFDSLFNVVKSGHIFDGVLIPIVFRSVIEWIKIVIILSGPDMPLTQVA